MPAKKAKALGVQLELGDGSPTEVFTPVAQLTNLGGPELIVETQDATAHDSADGYREHLETLRSYGEIPLEGLWDPAHASHDGTDGLLSKAEAEGPHNWKIIFPTDTPVTLALTASLVNLKFGDAPIDGVLPFSGSLKITGKPVWTP